MTNKATRLFNLNNVYTQLRGPQNADGGPNGYRGPYVVNGDVYVVGGSQTLVGLLTWTQVSKSPNPMSNAPQPNVLSQTPFPASSLLSNFEILDFSNQPRSSATGIWLTSITSYLDGTLLHICSYEGEDTDDGCFYNTFDTTTDTWSIVDEQIENTDPRQLGGTGGPRYRAVAISLRSDGDVIVGYEGNKESVMGADFARGSIGRRESGTWTVGISISGVSKEELHEEIGSVTRGSATDDRMHFFYKREAVFGEPGTFVAIATYKSDNTFGVQELSIQNTGVDNRHNMFIGHSFDRGGTRRIRVTWPASFVNQKMFGWDDEDVPTVVELGTDVISTHTQSSPTWSNQQLYDSIDDQLMLFTKISGPSPSLDLSDVQMSLLKAPAGTDDWPVGNSDEHNPVEIFIKWQDGFATTETLNMAVIIRNGIRLIGMIVNMGNHYFYHEITIEKSLIKSHMPFKHIIVR